MRFMLWIAGGLVAAFVTSIARRGRNIGIASTSLCMFGGVATGALYAWSTGSALEIWTDVGLAAFGGMALTGIAHGAEAFSHSGDQPRQTFAVLQSIHDLEDHLRRLSQSEREIFARLVHRHSAARDTGVAFRDQLTFGERLADLVAGFGGSWTFIWLFLAGMFGWMAYNLEEQVPFDPYPFILLNLVLSCVAALQAPVILMSQNRQAAKDRLQATNDYEVNLRAEMEIGALQSKLNELSGPQWETLIELQQRQIALLERIVEYLPSTQATKST